jgi:ribosomal protein S18 acetylase RimI-like enzyme
MGAKASHRKIVEKVIVRPLAAKDVDRIIDIDAKVMGGAKPEYWRRKLALYLAGRDLESITDAAAKYVDGIDPELARVAEVNGRVVGFMIGDIRSWEFRQPPTGWITALAVEPEYQRRGIARRLLVEFLHYFREKGLESVRTMMEWSDGEMLSFFTAMGFDRGPFIELEKKLPL